MEQNTHFKKLVQKQFSRTAHEYVTSESHAKGDDLALLVEWLSPSHEWIALDIATGGGHVAKSLAPYVNSVIATDLTKQMLMAARNHLSNEHHFNIQYVLADAECLPFLDDSFELVTCRIAPHHFPHPEKFVTEVFRVLKPSGHFLLIDNVAPIDAQLAEYMNRFEVMRDESHVRCPSVLEWESWIAQSGFQIEKSRLKKKTFNFPTWIGRMAISQDQVDLVENYILSGSAQALDYFNVQTQHDGHIQSLQIDEWMVHCIKP